MDIGRLRENDYFAMPYRHCVEVWDRVVLGMTCVAMRNRTTLLRAEHGLTAPFLRLAGRLKRNTTFEMDNRRI